MTKKHYEQMAVAVNTLRRGVTGAENRGAVVFFIEQLSSVLKQENARFDKDKFRKECGL